MCLSEKRIKQVRPSFLLQASQLFAFDATRFLHILDPKVAMMLFIDLPASPTTFSCLIWKHGSRWKISLLHVHSHSPPLFRAVFLRRTLTFTFKYIALTSVLILAECSSSKDAKTGAKVPLYSIYRVYFYNGGLSVR